MSKTLHNAQPKHCGCVKAEFVVEPDLPEELRVGVFKQPRSYPAWIRFSNQNGTVQSDIKGDIQGISINLSSEFLDLTGFCEKFDAKVTIMVETPSILVDYVKTCRVLVEMSNSGYQILGTVFQNTDLWETLTGLVEKYIEHFQNFDMNETKHRIANPQKYCRFFVLYIWMI